MGGVLDCHCHEIKADTAQGSIASPAAQSTAFTKPVQIKIIAPSSVYTIEVDEWETVLAVLEKAAPKLGLEKSDAPSLPLQLQSNNKPLAHELERKGAGLYDGAECWVLGVKEATAKRVDVVVAAKLGNVAAIRSVCEHAPKRVNDKDQVLLLKAYSLLCLV